MANKKAVLVGIDDYPDPRNRLNSCINDTLAFRKILTDIYAFSPSDITLLHNQNATLDNVRRALDALFVGASAGDKLVFYESSHGYRMLEGDTMVEVLCLYDKFFEDKELVDRTKNIPSSVLTVVLDACHAGGMDKVFFPGGEASFVRNKVFQPPHEDAVTRIGVLQQVTKIRFFGQKPTSDIGTVVKQFATPPTLDIPAAKELAEPVLNAALLAACMADETAAAGSPATSSLSAFTFGLTQTLDPSLPLRSLCDRVIAKVKSLNLHQTPVYWVPPANQLLADETFILMEPTSPAAPPPSPSPPGAGEPAANVAAAIASIVGSHRKQYIPS
ncbi:MAG: hypothetical protein JWM42_1056 [Burkholderia sp.]|jgi:hypothetical protein|nr:hypothetical protein [Burkholderia sp.]